MSEQTVRMLRAYGDCRKILDHSALFQEHLLSQLASFFTLMFIYFLLPKILCVYDVRFDLLKHSVNNSTAVYDVIKAHINKLDILWGFLCVFLFVFLSNLMIQCFLGKIIYKYQIL